jgi:hypothetical protein
LYGEQIDQSKRKNTMCEGTDLPDHDYESLYGREAMYRRLLARLDAAERHMDEQNATLEALIRRGDARNRDAYAHLFRFQMGQCVRWAAQPTEAYIITQRRWTQRDIVAPVVEYLLCRRDRQGEAVGWGYEPDLVTWDER